ncbi:MAG: tetratricopeptide repeat protein, partial [Nanoarchaeota archaeon]|nr:tetratricopeptide repeat protein [Nanoarchaeota archaeon]
SEAEKVIERQLKQKVLHFAYPYGIYNELALSAVRSRYATAVTIERGFLKTAGRFARQGILKNTSMEEFKQLLHPPTLSVAMIVKDEEKNLAQCLSSIQDLVDEIVIVDTGSTDKTKEIAAQFTNKIVDFKWVDDFAAARNEALKHATGNWILVLDADEIIAKEDHEKIKEAINNWDVCGYQILTRNYTNASSMTSWQPCSLHDSYARSYSGWFPSVKVRLFQRKDHIQFEGRIHEMVDSSISRNGGRLKVLPTPVHHYGDDAKDPAKVQRYLELSQKKVAENPADAKAYFELGVLYKEVGKYQEAENAFLESMRRDDIHVAPLLNLAIVQQKQKKYAAAIENYTLVLEKKKNIHPDAHFGLGFCFFLQNDLERALAHFQQAVIQNPHFVDAYINVGAVWERLGKFRQGIEVLQDALVLAPHNARAHYNLGVIYEKAGDLAKAMAAYEKAIELNYVRKAEIIPKVKKMKEILEESHNV